jgi:hypothetical protein
MEKKWITTQQMLENLKNDANHEHEYQLWLCNGFLTSAHWFVYDSKQQLFGHTKDWTYDWFSESELLEYYAGCQWMRYT